MYPFYIVAYTREDNQRKSYYAIFKQTKYFQIIMKGSYAYPIKILQGIMRNVRFYI